MSSCDESNVKKNYIVQTPTDFDILSACTGFYTNNIYNCTGDTLTLHSPIVSANTINVLTYLSGGTNLLDIFGSMDTNTFVSGFTYDNSNNLNIQRNDGVSFGVNISEYSGLTINGVLSACTGIYTSNLYGCSPITVNDDLILLNKLTLSAVTQDDTLTQILARNNSTGEVKYRDVSSIAPAAKLQNTYFVSSLSGDNSTALVGDINNPWKTITEARNQAVADGYSNSLIHVYSGEYLEDEIQYENGNFYFEPNSKVTTQRTASGGTTSIFRLGQTLVYESNTYSANTCNVYGYGDFSVSATTDTDAFGGFILSMLGDSNSYFEFNDAYVHSGEGFYAGGNSILTLEGHDILLDPSGSDGLDFSDTSTTLINVNDIVGGNSHWNIHYRTSFAGKSVVNFNKLIGSDQLIAFDRFMQPTAEITMNFNLIEHTGGSQYIINSGDNLGAKVTLNGDFYAPYGNGILLFHDDGEYNINGNITCRDTALLAVDVFSPSNDFVLNYNGDIVTSGVTSEPPPLNSNGGIELNKITANLNGSLTNLSLGVLSNGINIDDNSILNIDNFTINVASGNTIGTSSSNVVNIKHSLNINKPMSSGITTTGLFNYTGTTNVGDLVIYNTPTNDDTLTQILGRNSTTGDVEYRDVNSIISAATSQDTFVTGFTYDNINTFTISDNSGSTFNASINVLSATTISATTYFGDGSNLTGISTEFTVAGDNGTPFTIVSGDTLQFVGQSGLNIGVSDPEVRIAMDYTGLDSFILAAGNGTSITVDGANDKLVIYDDDAAVVKYINANQLPNNFVTGGTYNNGTDEINFVGNSSETTFDVGLSSLISSVSGDTFVVSGNADVATSQLTFTYNTGGTFTVTNSAALFSDNDINVTGGTYNPSNGCVTFSTNSGTTFDVCGFVTGITDTYVTGGTFSTNTLTLNRQNGSVTITGFTSDSNTTITGFTYNDANTFTISDSSGSTFDASINVMTGLTINGESTGTTLTVNGQSVFSGTSSDVVQIYGSGSTTPIFRVEGSAGELFSITDSLIGELFSVNNISGLPILTVNSDNTILWGDNTSPSLNTTIKKSINSGLSEIYSIPVSAYTGGFFEYTVTGAGARAGSIMSIFSGTSIDYNETTTNDIGDTSGVTFDMNISGGTANLTVSATTNSWEIKTIVRSI